MTSESTKNTEFAMDTAESSVSPRMPTMKVSARAMKFVTRFCSIIGSIRAIALR